MFKTAEILVVGSEFFTRFKTDTNSLWLTEQLEKRGVRVLKKTTVTDDLEALTAAFRNGLKGADLVISTGGLGPTEDDRTRYAFAAALGVELEHHDDIEEELRSRFEKRGRELGENNKKQADIPVGATVVPNPQGTAPGFFSHAEFGTLLCLPGPPREMKPLFEDFVERHLDSFVSDSEIMLSRVLRVTGLGESNMDRLISDLYKDLRNPEVTINFTPIDLEIHLTARAANAQEAGVLIDPLAEKMAERLEGYVFSTEDQSLVEVVVEILKKKHLTVGLAESLTAGLAASELGSVPGASEVLRGSFVTYTNEAKSELLGISKEMLETHGAVSIEVAEVMASVARERFGSNFGLSCTGIAGPGGGTEANPVGTAYLGFATAERVSVQRVTFPGDRNLVRARVAQAMLYRLYSYLTKL